jgi:hypothetical protein
VLFIHAHTPKPGKESTRSDLPLWSKSPTAIAVGLESCSGTQVAWFIQSQTPLLGAKSIARSSRPLASKSPLTIVLGVQVCSGIHAVWRSAQIPFPDPAPKLPTRSFQGPLQITAWLGDVAVDAYPMTWPALLIPTAELLGPPKRAQIHHRTAGHARERADRTCRPRRSSRRRPGRESLMPFAAEGTAEGSQVGHSA